MQDVSLVFDIGKTNKKLILFDQNLRVVHESSVNIPEISGKNGLIYDDLPHMLQWLDDALQEIGAQTDFAVRAINVTTFGATVVHVHEAGDPATPVYSYLSDPGEAFHQKYLDHFSELPGGFARLATPPLGMFLNAAKQLYWLTNEHSGLAANIHQTLFLPQFIIAHLTGKSFSEATSLGCHTGLWDFEQSQLSEPALSAAQWRDKLPDLLPENAVLSLKPAYRQRFHGEQNILVGTGLHDSSSALVPFSRALSNEHFVLLSTGTWIIAQNPGAEFNLSERDLAEDRLYYLTPQRKPVRAARLFAGREHEVQLERIANYFGRAPEPASTASARAVEAFLHGFFAESGERALVPETLHGSGPFPNCHSGNWDLSQFESAEEAYARLCLDLAALTSYCIDSVASEETTKVVVDGGFVRNAWFTHLLAMLQAPREVVLTEVPQATAMEAALMLHIHWAGQASAAFSLDLQPITAEPVTGLRLYAERFLANLQD